MTAWKTAKTAKTCSTFPHVWGAIIGCTGSGHAWRYTTGHFGRQIAEFACPTCQAMRDQLDAMTHADRQAELTRLQAAAGVADYRLAETRIVDGRPVLTGRVCPHRAEEQLEQALAAFGEGNGCAARVAALIVAFGRDCKALVARHCDAAQRAELVAAYRAAVR